MNSINIRDKNSIVQRADPQISRRNQGSAMDITAYLNRIDYRGALAPTAETLRALHQAHVLAVPFENLDIHQRRT